MKSALLALAVIAVAGIMALAAGTALARDVKTSYVPGTDFSKYKTYKSVAIEGAQYPDQPGKESGPAQQGDGQAPEGLSAQGQEVTTE